MGLLRDRWRPGADVAGRGLSPSPGRYGTRRRVGPGLSDEVLARAVIVWTQLFGMISFELFGQYVGSVDPGDEFFDYAIGEMAAFLGLRG